MDDRSVPGRTPPYSWYVVGVLTLANVSANVDQQILGALVGPIKRDFGMSDVQISYLTGLAFAVFYSVMGLPIARLADRSNRRNIMTAGVTLWSLFTALCATATTYGRLFVMRIGVGVGEAALLPPSVSMIADYVPRERLGRAMSIYSLGVFLGSGIGYFLAGWIVTLVSVQGDWIVPVIGVIRPWQSVFLAVGLPGLLVAALLLTVREPLRRGASGRAAVPLRVFVRYLRENRRTFLTHGFGFGLSSLVNFSLAFWIPSFFARTYGWQEAAALRVMGLLTMTLGVGGVLAGGWVTDWFVRRGRNARVRHRLRVDAYGDARARMAGGSERVRRLSVGRGVGRVGGDRSVAAARAGSGVVFLCAQSRWAHTWSNFGRISQRPRVR
jgi:MFS family permease